jgi:hypothetical protein
MSPLDAAREYAKYPDTYESEDETGALEIRCTRCDQTAASTELGWPSIAHAPDCPWLALPKIVAALEAARRHEPCAGPAGAAEGSA